MLGTLTLPEVELQPTSVQSGIGIGLIDFTLGVLADIQLGPTPPPVTVFSEIIEVTLQGSSMTALIYGSPDFVSANSAKASNG